MNRPMTTPYWRVVLLVAQKDLRSEVRGREVLTAMFLFSVLAVLIFSFALELDREAQRNSIVGILWVTIVFSSILGLSRSLAVEKDKGSLYALLIAPVQRSAIFYGKMLANLLFMLVIALLLLLLLSFLFNLNLLLWELAGVLLLGCFGFAVTGTMVSSISVHARARETLLPILLLPVSLPIILSAVRASSALLNDLGQAEWLPWVQILALVNVVFLVATYYLFDFVVEE